MLTPLNLSPLDRKTHNGHSYGCNGKMRLRYITSAEGNCRAAKLLYPQNPPSFEPIHCTSKIFAFNEALAINVLTQPYPLFTIT